MALSKGQFNSASLAEGWCEGSRVRIQVTCPCCNNGTVTLVRQMAAAARRLNAPEESGRWVFIQSTVMPYGYDGFFMPRASTTPLKPSFRGSREKIMWRVKIVNCGVPPRGCQTEYAVQVDGAIYAKSQGFPDGNLRQIAETETLAIGQTHYVDEKGEHVFVTAKAGAIRGPFRTSPGNPMGFSCMVMGPNRGWVPFHGYTSGDALRDAKAYALTLTHPQAA